VQPFMSRSRLYVLLAGLLSLPTLAVPPQPFEASYDARYDNMRASATRSLQYDANTATWTLLAEAKLTLLGATLTSISERSNFRWQDDQPQPLLHEFRQRGAGARQRSVRFDHEAGQAEYRVGDRQGTLPLDGPVFDELSGYLVLRERLAAGETDISLTVADRDKLETQRYQVLGEEELQTPLGTFATLRVARIRDAGSERRTELWLAPSADYLLIKLLQTEPNGRVIQLDLRSATLAGQVPGTP